MNEKFYLQSDIKEIFNNLKHLKKNLSGKKFLISGANGFLGKYFIKSLIEINKSLSKKVKILAIDIKKMEKIEGVDFMCCDFLKEGSKDKIIKSK